MFFRLSSFELALIIFGVIAAATVSGVLLGRYLRHRSETLREPFGVLQGALLGVVGLVLAFGLSLAVGRYEARRAAVVAEANAIGTTYLRAQLLAEPVRTRSLGLLRDYTDLALQVSEEVPGSDAMRRTLAAQGVVQRDLWGLAGEAVDGAPVATAPRLYVQTLNEMIDQQTVRVAGLNNRVPGAVLVLEVVGAAVALGVLGLYLVRARPRPGADARGRRADDDAAPRHVRPRPADPRSHHGARDAARAAAGLDGAAPGGWLAARGGQGTTYVTVVPRPGAESTSTCPPRVSIRSWMLVRPAPRGVTADRSRAPCRER